MAAPTYSPRLTASIVAAALFMGSLDSTIIATALPQMSRAFYVPPVDMSLGITIYILVMAACLPVSTWVADRLGARNVFAAAIAAFALASALCGFSHSLPQFVAARVLQAMAAALMAPVGNLVLFRTTEKKDLIGVVAISTTPGLIAPVIGPAIGGFIVTFLAWPWIFFLNLPIAAVGMALALRFIPNLKAGERRPFDWRGFVLTGASLAALMYGLDRISASNADRPLPAALIVLGVGLGVLAIRHSRRAAHPLISLNALKYKTFAAATLLGGTLVRIPLRSLGFILPLMFQVGMGMSAFKSGLLLLGYNGGDLLLKSVASRILRRTGFRSALVISAALTALCTATWMLFVHATPFWLIFGVLLFSGAARSVMFTAMSAMTYADVPRDEIGGATVLANVSNQVTGGVAIAMGAIILNISASLRGHGGGGLSLADCRIALAVLAACGLASIISWLRLPKDAGAAVSGASSREIEQDAVAAERAEELGAGEPLRAD